MSDYRSYFDEFGNLRENHSPWRLVDLLSVAVIVGIIALMASGVLA